MPDLLILHATEYDPWFNLALEEYMVEHVEQDHYDAVLYLWQNDQTVVIGRNQNAWAECLTGKLEAEGGKLARRSTGGGAVYHDLGNLNYSIVTKRTVFDIDMNFNMILDAVSSLGIAAERSGRNDILANGLKFSGNAFGLRRKTGLHHGTLLVSSDFGRLARYLTVPTDKLKAKGVASVRSRVTNLKDLQPDITVESLMQAMEHSFCLYFRSGSKKTVQHKEDTAFREKIRLQTLNSHYASWTWRYGESLSFDVTVQRRFSWGSVEIGFLVNRGRVKEAKVYSDALDSDYILNLPKRLKGCRFHSEDLARCLHAEESEHDSLLTARRTMTSDIIELINEQNW